MPGDNVEYHLKLVRTGLLSHVALSVQVDDVNVLLHFWAESPRTSMTCPPLYAERSNRRPASAIRPWFQLSALGLCAALASGLFSAPSHALTLGRLDIQSSLGQPLRAEIIVTEATPEEIAGLRVRIASADAFKAAGVPFNPVLTDMRVNLQRRTDGRYGVRLTSNSSLSEPFVDLLLEATWPSGRIVRDYTVLLDPPSGRQAAAPAAPIPPVSASSSPPRGTATAPPANRPRAATAAAPQASSGAPAPSTANNSSPATRSGSGQQLTVQPGDTASKIAGAYKPAELSLDQMLVALLRANPSAFVNGNVNRLRAGAVLDLPPASEAASVTDDEARRTVIAQSRDFGDYRRRLADNAPTTRVAQADRRTGGKLQADVEERNASAATPDKLKISQGLAPGALTDEQLARQREARDAAARVAELTKNIEELKRLQQANAASTGADPAKARVAATPAAPAPAAPNVAASGSPPSVPAQSPAPASPSSTSNAPAAAATAGAASPGNTATTAPTPGTAATPAGGSPANPAANASRADTAPAVAESSLIDEFKSNPLYQGGAALLALLLGFLLFRLVGRKKSEAGDSVFMESRLPKDSFFGANGGQSVDTKDRGNTGLSSLSYSHSQLDAGDVDPVAEADVYLAYGRDLQAEEILREALRVNPERAAIHLKLLEIHAKRRDARAFEASAHELKRITKAEGPDWARGCELGREIEPANPLYQGPSVSTATPAEMAAFAGTLAAAGVAAGNAAGPIAAPAVSQKDARDGVDYAPVSMPVPLAPSDDEERPAFVPSVAPLDFDLDLDKSKVAPAQAPRPQPERQAERPAAPDTTDEPDFDFTLPATLVAHSATPSQREDEPTDLTDFGAEFAEAAPSTPIPSQRATPQGFSVEHLPSLDLDQDFDTAPGALEEPTARAPLGSGDDFSQPATLRAGLPGDSGFIEFDMSALGGLSGRARADTEPGQLENLDAPAAENPHVIKLSLARELKDLGDIEGARSLVEEVAAESSGEVNVEAKQLLGQLR